MDLICELLLFVCDIFVLLVFLRWQGGRGVDFRPVQWKRKGEEGRTPSSLETNRRLWQVV